MSCACGLAKLHQLIEYSHFMCTSRCFILLCTYVEYLLFVIRTSTRTDQGAGPPGPPLFSVFIFPLPPTPSRSPDPPLTERSKTYRPIAMRACAIRARDLSALASAGPELSLCQCCANGGARCAVEINCNARVCDRCVNQCNCATGGVRLRSM